MSARIAQIIEVIEEARDYYRNSSESDSIAQLRIQAAHSIAARRNINYRTVLSKFIRQLRPDIHSAFEFDSLLEAWLVNNSFELRDILLRHTADTNDEPLVRNAFHKAQEQDILLSQEFDFDPNEQEFKEGKEKLKIHLSKERSQQLVKEAKRLWSKEGNAEIKCCICFFSFSKTYGEIGAGYIEAHHKLPLSKVTNSTVVRVSDLAPLCSNCHRIIHRYRPWLTIEELKKLVERQNGQLGRVK